VPVVPVRHHQEQREHRLVLQQVQRLEPVVLPVHRHQGVGWQRQRRQLQHQRLVRCRPLPDQQHQLGLVLGRQGAVRPQHQR